MAIYSPPRLDWAPGDSGLVSYRNRQVQLHDAAGKAIRELAADRIYDVRFQDDGKIILLDDRGSVTYKRDGELVEQTHFRMYADAASMSANGDRYVARTPVEIFAVQLVGEKPDRIWTLHAESYGIDFGGHGTAKVRVGIEMSPDGKLVAIGYKRGSREWLVIELATDQFLQRSQKTELLPAKTSHLSSTAPQLFAFDASGTRLAHGHPDVRSVGWGVTRLEVEDRELARTVPGGVVAVALDRGGLLAAYAYEKPPDGARGRLRIDYLSPEKTGAGTVEAIDTLSIDPELPDVVALAFSRDSRQLACLASTGEIEIVPTP